MCRFALHFVQVIVVFGLWHWLQSSIRWYILGFCVGVVHFRAPSIRSCLVLILMISLLIFSFVVFPFDDMTFALRYVVLRLIVCPGILISSSVYGLPTNSDISTKNDKTAHTKIQGNTKQQTYQW